MKLVLISLYDAIAAPTVRLLSEYARDKGHEVRTLFLLDRMRGLSDFTTGFSELYPESMVSDVVDAARDADLVGISAMTNFVERARQLSLAIKEAGVAPVVIGGIHATAAPEECLEFADYACIGEGEDMLVELLEAVGGGKDVSAIANLVFMKDGRVVSNPVRPLIQDIDTVPVPKFHSETDMVASRDGMHLVDLTREELIYNLEHSVALPGRRSYHIHTTRGCPYDCSFCCNSTWKRLYPEWHRIRKRSSDHLFEELNAAKKELDINYVVFDDDTFVSRPIAELQDLMERYRKEIGVPFHIEAAPPAITRERVEALVDGGMDRAFVGIQSGSPRMLERYSRKWGGPDVVLRAARIMNEFSDRMIPGYDIILDDPAAGVDDMLDTLHLAMKLPKPCTFQLFSLSYYPGTALDPSEFMDVEHAQIQAKHKHYHNKKRNYINFLFSMLGSGFPPTIIRLAAWRPLVLLLNRKALEPLIALAYHVGRTFKKGIRSLR